MRSVVLFGAAAILAAGQGSIYTVPFAGLATPYDGSVVYFSSVLRIKGSNQPLHGKLFVADESGVRLFRSREKVDPPPPQYPGQCNSGPYYEFYNGAELNAAGDLIAAPVTQSYAGSCTRLLPATDLIARSGEREIQGTVRLSANGRYALEYTTFMFGEPSVKYLDLTSGLETPVTLPQVGPYLDTAAWGRLIADDGTALFAGYVLRPDAAPVPWPLPEGGSAPVIDAAGRHILYSFQRQDVQTFRAEVRLEVLELATNQTRVLMTGSPLLQYMLSDDGSTAMYVQDGHVFVAPTDGSGPHALGIDGVTSAVLSGDGKVVYASTSVGRLIKIDAGTGRQTEIIGRTPFLANGGYVDAGLVATIGGIALSETSLQGTPPLNPWLGNLTMWMGNRKVPVFAVSPTEVRFLVPWDMPASAQASVLAEVAGEHSPFDFPQTTIGVWRDGRAGAVAHQDWSSLAYFGPFKLGEIVHVSAVGLGAVTPEVPPGAVAPSKEPLARLATPLTCQDSDVLYAGLAPGTLERIYQIDLRLNATGYRRFDCSAEGKPVLGLTFYVVP